MKRIFSVGLIAFFLVTAQGAAMTAFAADWELWPRGRGKATPEGTPAPQQKAEDDKKAAVPPVEGSTKEAAAAAKEGKEAGKAVEAGVSSGTIGKAAAITAGVVAIGIAVGGGGGGTTTVHH